MDWKRTGLAVALLVVCVRVGLLFAQGGFGVLSGHDGAEYLAYGEAVSRWDWSAVPEAARRHNPGWPLLIGGSAFIMGGVGVAVCAWGLMLVFMAGTVLILNRLYRRFGEAQTQGQSAALCAVAALGYPTLVYFQSYALVDSALLFFAYAAVLAYLSRRMAWFGICLAVAVAIRAPVWLIAPALVGADVLIERRVVVGARRTAVALAWSVAAVVPLVVSMAVMKHAWGVTFLDTHQPVYGVPGSGLLGFGALPLARQIYIALALCAVGAGICGLARLAWRSRGENRLATFGALFGAAFMVFHLSMKSLVYHGATIALVNYQDRYLTVLWPLAILPFARFFNRWVVSAMIVVAVALALYWNHNWQLAALAGVR